MSARVDRGFTLIELLIVITIMAVLAGAALPYVQSYVNESRSSKAKADLDEIGRALAIYEAREGDYIATTVALLTGRYLNKAPIDPWGQPYFINASAGLVVLSAGPNRIIDGDDDITFPYQPPLALVQCKWVDKNQTGAVDVVNVADQLQLQFSRRVKGPVVFVWASIALNGVTALSPTIVDAAPAKWLASKTLVLNVAGPGMFTPGSDTIMLKAGSGLADLNSGLALTDQPVIIVPQ